MSHNKKLKNSNKQGIELKIDYNQKYYSFDFSCLTTDSHYNFDGIGKLFPVENVKHLFSKLKNLSSEPVVQISQKDKKSGFEFMAKEDFLVQSFFDEIDKKYKNSKDTKYMCFRFASQKCRIICKQSEEKGRDTVLYVICIDWKMDTYKHNK